MLRTRVVWTGVAGTPYYSTFYWSGDTAPIAEDAQLQTIAWAENLAPIICDPLVMQVESEVLGINAETGVIFDAFDVPGSTTPGEYTSQPLPFQIQVLTYFGTTTFRRGRRVVGRSFLPGLYEDANLTGVGPEEPIREAVQGVYNNQLGGGPAGQVVWSRPTPGASDGEISPITSRRTSATWSSLRSRRAV